MLGCGPRRAEIAALRLDSIGLRDNRWVLIDLEQIQFLLGHASILTTERYLGSRQNLRQAVNDNLGLEIEA